MKSLSLFCCTDIMPKIVKWTVFLKLQKKKKNEVEGVWGAFFFFF